MNNYFKILVLPILLFFISTILAIIPDNINSFNDFSNQFDVGSYIIKVALVGFLIIIYIISIITIFHYFCYVFYFCGSFSVRY